MKYNINGFDQQKVCDLGLDHADTLILQWVMDFSVTRSSHRGMLRFVDDHRIFYLVKYEAIIKDLPILGITSIKGISKRFDKYVEAGLLEKQCRRVGAGTQTFFSFTDLIVDLKYSKEDYVTVKATDTSSDKNSSSYQSHEENSSSYQNTDENQSSCQKGTPVAVRKELQLPSDENSSSFALNNSSINTMQLDTATTTHEISQLKDIFSQINPELVFSQQFYPAAVSFFEKNGIEDIPAYCSWLYQEVLKRKPEKLRGYYYSVFLREDNALAYLAQKMTLKKESQKHTVLCPVCGKEIGVYDDNCTECGLVIFDRDKEDVVEKQRRIYLMPEDKKDEYYKALEQAYKDSDCRTLSSEFIQRTRNIELEFGISV